MSELYKNKYRIPSARLQTWNYAANALYFITICTANRECFFGNIINTSDLIVEPQSVETQCIASLQRNTVQLNDQGKTVEIEWLKTQELRQDMNLELYEYIVMPNHFHGIISIGDNQYNTAAIDSNDKKNKFGPQSKNLASIIRGFKSAVTTFARKDDVPFNWQPRFHDHIIRSNDEYLKIADYILNNPDKWEEDKFYIK